MTTIVPPPPAPSTPGGSTPAPTPPPHAPRGPRTSARVIAILAIALGAALVLGTMAVGALGVLRTAARHTETLTTDAAGIRQLDIDVADTQLRVVYAGDAVTLVVTGSAADWKLRRDGESLEVRTDRLLWRGAWFGEGDDAVLTLPRSLEDTAIDADLSMSAGALSITGTYRELGLELNAGSIGVKGSAEQLHADVSAGRLTFDLDGADTADLQLSAGDIAGTLTGAAPTDVTLDASAGRLDLTLPKATYAVTSDVSAGQLKNSLDVDPTSPRRVAVDVSAGFVALRS